MKTINFKDEEITIHKNFKDEDYSYKILGLYDNGSWGIFDEISTIRNHPNIEYDFILLRPGGSYQDCYPIIYKKGVTKLSYKYSENNWTYSINPFWNNSEMFNGVSVPVPRYGLELKITDQYGDFKIIDIAANDNDILSPYLKVISMIGKYSQYNSWYDYLERNLKSKKKNIVSLSEDKSDIETSEPEDTLTNLIGLGNVKKDVKELTNLIKIRKLRSEKGLSVSPSTLHLVFTGNPGTGKRTVARLLGKIYKDIGVLEKGHFVEADRSSLVAEYIGQTAPKTTKVFESALGGILFIDEAYSLSKGGDKDFGQEAIATLLKLMEDNRDKIVVIIAGYTDEINEFLNSNPGLRSRFPKYIHFDDYNTEELLEICKQYLSQNDYSLNVDAEIKLTEMLPTISNTENFGNARGCRNLAEKIVTQQSSRIIQKKDPTKEELITITEEDINNAFE